MRKDWVVANFCIQGNYRSRDPKTHGTRTERETLSTLWAEQNVTPAQKKPAAIRETMRMNIHPSINLHVSIYHDLSIYLLIIVSM